MVAGKNRKRRGKPSQLFLAKVAVFSLLTGAAAAALLRAAGVFR